ncbi:phospholipid scramblase 2 [Papilio machaon]|uniref:phospholipid scramblase 2 n=1 Tax=Papilio machaon TaxID=76193 RepID=UPI001E6648F9|nr:phospholipid scramblase 2 [Papilio machaon]
MANYFKLTPRNHNLEHSCHGCFVKGKGLEMTQAAPIPSVPDQVYGDLVKEPVSNVVAEVLEPCQKSEETPPSLLDDLTSVEHLMITKRLRVKSVLFLRGKRNRFQVRTPDRNLVYTVEEENSWWVGYFCYGLRPLQLRVCNSVGAEVLRVRRPYACTPRVLPCQLQHLQVFSPPGHLIGTIEQQWAAVRPVYLIKKENGEELFWIRGPFITLSLFRDVEFGIARADGVPVGSTCKRWQGLLHAMFFAPITDRFNVEFDRSLSVEEKALLLAATLLIDYMYYDV